MRDHLQRRRARGRLAGDSGVTLIELLISMTVFSIILAGVYSVLFTVQRQTADETARADSVGDARLSLQVIDRQVRSGNVLYSPAAESIPGLSAADQCTPSGTSAGSCMRVFTQANGTEKCVQWQVLTSSKILRTRSWSPTWVTDGLVSGWSVSARNVVNTATSPAFSLSGGNYGARLVDLTLKVKAPRARGNAVDVVSSLSGRNTAYGFDPGVCTPIPPG